MEVTRANFEAVFPRVAALLADAAFYTVDFEMTGIRTAEDKSEITDPAAAAFVEKNKAAQRYTLVQFGICIFMPRPGCGEAGVARYDAYPFNFFLFPGDKDADVCINVDTAAFLSKHGMDFTKWITQGVPYLKATEAARRRAAFRGDAEDDDAAAGDESSPSDAAAAASPTAPKKKRAWDQSMLAKVEKCDNNNFTTAMAEAARYVDKCAEYERSEGRLPEPAPQPIPQFKDRGTIGIFTTYLESIGLARTSTRTAKGVQFSMVSAAATQRRAAQDVEAVVGLTRLYEAMVACKKPIAVHNGLMDLLFMHHHFDGAPISDLAEFKRAVHERFPTVFDTRYLATHPSVPFDAKMVQNLEGQFLAFQQQHRDAVVVELPLGFDAYDPSVLRQTSRAHEAAYDALMTGQLLLFMARQLGDGTLASLERGKFANKVPVYGCLETVRLAEATDCIDHDGPVIAFKFPRNAGMSSTRIDQMLATNDLRGRVLWNGDRAFVFSPANARGTLFDKSVAHAAKQLRQVTPRGSVTVLVA